MIIHGGNLDRKRTTCNKPLARRWWVNDRPYRTAVPGFPGLTKTVDSRKCINCKDCIKNTK